MKTPTTLQTTDIIFKTHDYDLFKFQNGNRHINKANYKKLLQSVKEQQLRIPIIVNEKMEIIDGQHRFLSWKEEGQPIYYIVNEGYGIQETKRANIVSSNWTSNDFLNTYVAEGNNNYIVFNDIKRMYGISISDLLFLFTLYQSKNINSIKEDFHMGRFSIEGEENVRLFLETFELFNDFAYSKNTKFLRAFAKIYSLTEYSHDKMTKQYQSQGYKLKKQNSLDDYILMLLNDIYNYSTTKNRIGYDRENQIFYGM